MKLERLTAYTCPEDKQKAYSTRSEPTIAFNIPRSFIGWMGWTSYSYR